MSESAHAEKRPIITLPERISKYVSSCESAIAGQHGHDALFKACVALTWGFGLNIEQAWPYAQDYNARCQPPWGDGDLKRKLKQALNHPRHRKPRGHLLGDNVSNDSVAPADLSKAEPAWPKPDLSNIDAIVSAGRGLYDLWEQSLVRYDDSNSHTEEIIDCLFPGNPLLCAGKTNYKFATRRREVWRGRLAELPLIVPNPMLAIRGKTQEGKLSEHTLEATAKRVYQVIEFDFAEYDRNGKPTCWLELVRKWRGNGIEVADACSALILHLRDHLTTLACACYSGGKSVHAWFRVFDLPAGSQHAFIYRAVRLGADYATWSESQFVRLPDGRRITGERQTTHYFDPREAVKL
jgi:hypothetical protein